MHKITLSLRPIVSLIGSATHRLSKCLKCIFSPLVCKTNFTTQNSTKFVKSIKDFSISNSRKQMSFYVVSLFTIIPLDLAKQSVHDRLSSDSYLKVRTTLSVPEVLKAMDICFSSTSFTLQTNHMSADIWHSNGLALISHHCKRGNGKARKKGLQ